MPTFLYSRVLLISVPLKKLAKLSQKSNDKCNIALVCSKDSNLKNIVDEIALEIGASTNDNQASSKNSLLLEIAPSEKLVLQFDHSNFADGFTESVTRNIGKIWQQEFEVCGEGCQKGSNAVKIYLPPELYSRVQWFVYLFLDGLTDKRIGRRWIK